MALSFRRNVVRHLVIVNMKTGRAFRGILWKQAGSLLVLRNAEMLEPNRPPVPVDGQVVIERTEVEFIQMPIAEGR
jgi:small nuclear ribonucleoprotein (snRNP)-like protein